MKQVFSYTYHWIKKDINDDENIFDIVAGTSIGAINATIITSHYLERKEELQRKGDQINHSKCWEEAPKKLLDFWGYISSSPNLYSEWVQNLTSYWLSWIKMNPYIKIPSNEAFRRYLTTRSSLIWGNHMSFNHYFLHLFLLNSVTNSLILPRSLHRGIDIQISL